jgi:hypothetical protein
MPIRRAVDSREVGRALGVTTATAMLKGARLSDEGRADLAEVAHAAQRATELTRKLLPFSRKQTMQPRVIQLDDGVRDAERGHDHDRDLGDPGR